MTEPREERFGVDPKPYFLAFGLLALLELARRAMMGYVPDDFTAYLSAADTFWTGANPYADYAHSLRYNGKPYNYFPGTLYLIVWMAWVPTVVAVVADYVARMTALYFALRWLGRRILPDIPPQFPLLIAFACEPLMIDVLFGNFVSFLLAAWVACVYLGEQAPTTRRTLAAAGCGLVLAFKPFWLPAAAYAFYLHRNWRGLAGLVVGAGTVGALSLLHLDWADEFFAHTQAMREYYFSVDFLSLAPPMLVVAALMWGAAALIIDRRGDREFAFIFGCASLVMFPRLATYSYTFGLPIVFFLMRRWGAWRGLLYGSLIIGPIPWMLRVSTLMPGERLENWAHFIWALVSFGVLFALLRKPPEGETA